MTTWQALQQPEAPLALAPALVIRGRMREHLCLACADPVERRSGRLICDGCACTVSYCPNCNAVKPIVGPDGRRQFYPDRQRVTGCKSLCIPCARVARRGPRVAPRTMPPQAQAARVAAQKRQAAARVAAASAWLAANPGGTARQYAEQHDITRDAAQHLLRRARIVAQEEARDER